MSWLFWLVVVLVVVASWIGWSLKSVLDTLWIGSSLRLTEVLRDVVVLVVVLGVVCIGGLMRLIGVLRV